MKRDPTRMPIGGLYGWGSAQTILNRVKDQERKALLTQVVRQVGAQGAPALGYAARWARWIAGDADAPAAPRKLTPAEIRYVERRVGELLDPYQGDPRVPNLRTTREAA